MMMTVLQILYIEPLGVGLILFTISALYFAAGRHQPTTKRVLKSSHGILFFCTMYPVVAHYFSVFSNAGWLSYPFWVFVGLVSQRRLIRYMAIPGVGIFISCMYLPCCMGLWQHCTECTERFYNRYQGMQTC